MSAGAPQHCRRAPGGCSVAAQGLQPGSPLLPAGSFPPTVAVFALARLSLGRSITPSLLLGACLPPCASGPSASLLQVGA